MYTAKHAMLYKHRVHDGQAYIFYMDVRAGGKKYEEFYKKLPRVFLSGGLEDPRERNVRFITWFKGIIFLFY